LEADQLGANGSDLDKFAQDHPQVLDEECGEALESDLPLTGLVGLERFGNFGLELIYSPISIGDASNSKMSPAAVCP
jgi:hypothetical protein